MSGWVGWHEAYDVPGSSLRLRLELVRRHLCRAVEEAPAGPIRLISACAGQGHDVTSALAAHPRRADVTGRLIELDARNAAIARERLTSVGLTGLEVVEADAGLAAAYDGALPASIVLMCGVFGNLTPADVHRTIAALPALCAPDAWVIWTHHRQVPDATPRLRGWFKRAGFREVAFEAPEDREVGVGVHRLIGAPAPFDAGRRLFTFAGTPAAPGHSIRSGDVQASPTG